MHDLRWPADDGSRGWCGPQPVGRGLGPLTRHERPKPSVRGAVEGSEAHRPPAPLTTEGDSLPSPARGGGSGCGVMIYGTALSRKCAVSHRRNLLPSMRGDMIDGPAQSGASWHQLISAVNRRLAKNR